MFALVRCLPPLLSFPARLPGLVLCGLVLWWRLGLGLSPQLEAPPCHWLVASPGQLSPGPHCRFGWAGIDHFQWADFQQQALFLQTRVGRARSERKCGGCPQLTLAASSELLEAERASSSRQELPDS